MGGIKVTVRFDEGFDKPVVELPRGSPEAVNYVLREIREVMGEIVEFAKSTGQKKVEYVLQNVPEKVVEGFEVPLDTDDAEVVEEFETREEVSVAEGDTLGDIVKFLRGDPG